jgi:hypothetical protein
MAKEGIDYFSLDCHLDDKFKLLVAEHGMRGFGVIISLLQRIYGDHGYYCDWNTDVCLVFSSEVNEPFAFVSEVVNSCLKRGLFSKSKYDKYHILTSKGVQTRYLTATRNRINVVITTEFSLISDVRKLNSGVSFDSSNVSSIESYVSLKQSKVKESKVNKRLKDCSPPSEKSPPVYELPLNTGDMHGIYPEDIEEWHRLYQAVDVMGELGRMKAWLNRNPKKRKTKRGINRFITNWLSREQDEGGHRPVVSVPPKTKTNSFNNFEQRNYDFDDLEKQLLSKKE